MHQARGARGAGLSLRHAKRYHIADSPLTAISWWRLMLDEAQNVGDGFSQVRMLYTAPRTPVRQDKTTYLPRVFAALSLALALLHSNRMVLSD